MIALAVLIVLALAAVVVLAFGKPAIFTVQRTLEIAAPADLIYAEVANFRRWKDWSPFEKLDPDMQKTYSGPDGAIGQVYEWSGNKKAGAGKMVLRELEPGRKVGVDLHMSKPFPASNDVIFSFIPEGGVTKTSWTMHGKSPFMFRLMSVFMDMDAMIGKDFEHGLHKLKDVTQRG